MLFKAGSTAALSAEPGKKAANPPWTIAGSALSSGLTALI
jgi:hypothetical protein